MTVRVKFRIEDMPHGYRVRASFSDGRADLVGPNENIADCQLRIREVTKATALSVIEAISAGSKMSVTISGRRYE